MTVFDDRGVMLGVVLGVATAMLVLVMLLVMLVVYRCRSKTDRRESDSSQESVPTSNSSQSAPNTRASSPNPQKRSLYTAAGTSGPLVRSVTMEMIPDFNMPAETIQTGTSPESRHDMEMDSMLQFQYNMLGHIQPDRFSLVSLDDDGYFSESRHPGKLFFSVLYDAIQQILHVTTIKVTGLPGRDRNNSMRDPFVKIYLLPDDKTNQTTRVIKKTLSPVFNETLDFRVPVEEVTSRTLRMSVYDVDKRRVRHSLGHVFLPLEEIDLTQNEMIIRVLEDTTQTPAALGEISLSLTFNATAEKMKVVVVRLRNVLPTNFNHAACIYIRAQLMHGLTPHKSRKSVPLPISTDPSFNESFSFNVPCRQLDACSIRISVMTSPGGVLSSKDVEYGRVTVGSYLYARGDQNQHWQDMISNSRVAVTRWHTLEPPPSTDTK